MEQPTPPLKLPQTDKIIEVATYNVHSVNKVLVQQILETIGQITKKTLDRNPQQIMKLKPMIFELYRQLTCFLFNLEAEEKTKPDKFPYILKCDIWLQRFGMMFGRSLTKTQPKCIKNLMDKFHTRKYEARKYP